MSPRQATLQRILQRHPEGMKLSDIIITTAGTHYTATRDLRALRDAKLAGPSEEGGAGVLWAAIEHLPALKAKRAADRAELAAAARKRAALREATAPERAAEEDACEAFASGPVHRLLSQDDWLGMPPTRGVSSVFHLGATAA